MTKQEIVSLIREKERKYSLPEKLLEAVVQIESNFKPDALGAAGEIGLTQLLKRGAIAEWEQAKKPLDYWKPENNLEVAAWYLGVKIPAYLKHYKIADTVHNRIWAYNAGIGNVVRQLLPQITKNYIAKVDNIRGSVSSQSGDVLAAIALLLGAGYVVGRAI